MDGLPRLLEWQQQLLDAIEADPKRRWFIDMPRQHGSSLPPGILVIRKDETDDR